MDRTVKISKTAESIEIYGLGDALNYQVNFHMQQLTRDLNNQIIYGRRVERSATSESSFGGVLEFMDGGMVDVTGGDLSKTHINNAFEKIFENGGMSNRYAICTAPNQARKITGFMGEQETLSQNQTQATSGFAVNRFVGDIPAFEGNPFQAFVAVDPNLPKDQILILDLDRIDLVPLQGRSLTDSDATPPGADYFARRILGEYTLKVMNGKTAHGKVVGLNI